MRYILISDLHLTSKQPRHRTGDILKDVRRKLNFIFKLAKEKNAYIISAGDIFDSPRDIFALYEFLKVKAKYPEIMFYAVYGQHDSYMRNKAVVNNLKILSKTYQITLLNDRPIQDGLIRVYGVDWGNDQIPIPLDNEFKFNILVIHAPITNTPLWSSQEYIDAEDFLNKHKFDLIVTGDIHKDFIIKKDNRYIVNTGPILRLEATTYNIQHKPMCYLFDRQNPNKIEKYIIPNTDMPFDLRFKNSPDIGSDLIDIDSIKFEKNDITIDRIINKLVESHENKKDILNILTELEKDNV